MKANSPINNLFKEKILSLSKGKQDYPIFIEWKFDGVWQINNSDEWKTIVDYCSLKKIRIPVKFKSIKNKSI